MDLMRTQAVFSEIIQHECFTGLRPCESFHASTALPAVSKQREWLSVSTFRRTENGTSQDSFSIPERKTSPQRAGRGTFEDCRTGQAAKSKLPQRDEYSWTRLISQYTNCGQGRQALRTYEDMGMDGVKPSSYTFLAALKACSSLQDLKSAKRIHAEVVKAGFQSNVYVGNMLLHVYVKCGSMLDARYAFEQMPHRNVVSWTTMILGYSQMEECEGALQLYERMQQEGVAPNERTFLGALKACSSLAASQEGNGPEGILVKRQCLEQVRVIHSCIVKSGSESDVYVGAMLVDAYGKCGSLVDARHVFDTMHHHNVVSWTAMIFVCVQMEEGEEALRLYQRMQQEGVEPNDRTFVGALKACSSLAAHERDTAAGRVLVKKKCLEQVRAIHSDVVKSGSESSVFVGNMLVDSYSRCGSLVDARRVFEKIPQRTVVSWTSMIFGCAHMERGQEALKLYKQMQQQGVVPNTQTFVAVLKACGSLAASEEGNEADGVKQRCLKKIRGIHAQLVKSGSESVVFVGNMLVDVYAKCGSLVDARSVFEKMPHRSVVSWTAMILGYAHMNEGELALQLYTRMQQEGVIPDDRAFVGALKACGTVAGLEKGKEIHSHILKAGCNVTDPFLASSLVEMYSKCGSMVDAQQVFDALPTRDIIIWNSLIAGYARVGESARVFDLFEIMQRGSIQPDIITVLNVLTVCSHVGLLDEGQKYFKAMSQDLGMTPNIEHYTCMVDILGRAGQLDKAMVMVETMPFQPDIVVWKAVLNSCRKWSTCGAENPGM